MLVEWTNFFSDLIFILNLSSIISEKRKKYHLIIISNKFYSILISFCLINLKSMKGFSLYTFKRRSFKVSCNCRCEICCPVKVVNTKETFTLSKYYSYHVPLKLVLLPGLDYLPYISQHSVVKSRFIVLRTMFFFAKIHLGNAYFLDF